jgi:hypothetical protein
MKMVMMSMVTNAYFYAANDNTPVLERLVASAAKIRTDYLKQYF